MKLHVTLILFLLMISRPLFAAQAIVLCYHTFLGKPAVYTDFSISEFNSHIKTLKNAGFTFVTWSQIAKRQITGTKNVLIVIDDGNRSTYWAYQQVLKPLKIKPMLAIYPGIIGSRRFALTWEHLLEMHKDGCELASHGYFHQYFSEKYAQSHPKDFHNEIVLSQKILAEKSGKPITLMVYPFGVTSNAAIQLMKHSGYQYAFSLRQKPLTPAEIQAHPYDLPRWMMTRSGASGILKKVIQGSFS